MNKHYEYRVMSLRCENYPDGKWENGTMWATGKRMVKSEEEIKEALNKLLAYWNGEARTETSVVGVIGISSTMPKYLAEKMKIVDYRIERREVTDWDTM